MTNSSRDLAITQTIGRISTLRAIFTVLIAGLCGVVHENSATTTFSVYCLWSSDSCTLSRPSSLAWFESSSERSCFWGKGCRLGAGKHSSLSFFLIIPADSACCCTSKILSIYHCSFVKLDSYTIIFKPFLTWMHKILTVPLSTILQSWKLSNPAVLITCKKFLQSTFHHRNLSTTEFPRMMQLSPSHANGAFFAQ